MELAPQFEPLKSNAPSPIVYLDDLPENTYVGLDNHLFKPV